MPGVVSETPTRCVVLDVVLRAVTVVLPYHQVREIRTPLPLLSLLGGCTRTKFPRSGRVTGEMSSHSALTSRGSDRQAPVLHLSPE